MVDVLVWNGRVANAAPTKRDAFVAASPAVKKTAGSGDALEVRHAQALTVVAERGRLVSVEEPRST
jgi:hypothetical protein